MADQDKRIKTLEAEVKRLAGLIEEQAKKLEQSRMIDTVRMG